MDLLRRRDLTLARAITMQAMRAALAILFGLICLFGVVQAHGRQQVPFDRRISGPRSKDDSPGWYWSMMVLYGVGGVGLVIWGIKELMLETIH